MAVNRLPERSALLLACAAAAFGLLHGLSWHPSALDRMRDDAWYEFEWAANVAHGCGPTVSAGTTTSGVQYLWCLLLVLAQWCGVPAPALPAAACALGVVAHVLGAASWVVAGRGRTGAWCVGLLWLGNPLLVRECQNGQETALACLLLALLWQQRRAPPRVFVPLLALAVAARSDLWPAGALLACTRHGARWWRGLPAPLAVLAAQLLVNRCLGGGWLQDSALPMAWLWHANFAATAPDLLRTLHEAWWFARPVLLGGPFGLVSAPALGLAVFLLVRPWCTWRWRWLPPLLVGMAAALGMRDLATAGWAALLLALCPAPRRRPVPWPLAALALGLLALLAVHWAVRWYPRDYYAAPLAVLAGAALLAVRRVPLLLLGAAAVQLYDCGRVPPEPLQGQHELELAGRFLDRFVPAGERVGCFNAGLVAWRWRQPGPPAPARVLGLDGVVDARALAALQAAGLDAWLDAQGVRFLVDNPAQMALDPSLPHACGRWFGPDFRPARDLVEIARFDVPEVDGGRPGTDSVRLWWRRGRGAPPTAPVAACALGAGPDGSLYVLWPARAGAVLETEAVDGTRRALLTADADVAIVVAVPAARVGSGRLFERDRTEPLLLLRSP